MTFKSDLINGRKIEREFAQKLVTRNIKSIEFAPDGPYKDWDIKVTYDENGRESVKTFEVKDDIISSKTGNVGFEYRCYGKPSGIYASKADYIVYHIDNKFYFQDRGELLTRLHVVDKRISAGGDNNGAELILVNKCYLPTLFKEMT